MKLATIAVVAAATFALSALPASAAWQTATEDSDSYYVAWVNDSADKMQLSIDCDTNWMESSIAIISDEAWDAAETYPESVPVAFSIDGHAFAATRFVVENAGGNVGIAAYEWDAPEVYDLIGQIGLAEHDIQVAFLDQNLHFPAEKVFDAAAHVQVACLF